ncbi:MAG TPA: class I SAM-dependent methyltransferase [Gammaproteobacteria bacterium]|nr:class I SAM-dependent methyltransferase [Gammaproteobacteria bacterium]
MPTIAVFTSHVGLQSDAKQLARELQLPFIAEKTSDYEYLLILTPAYLALQKAKSKPLYVDFLSKKMQYRRQQMSLRKEALARALGLKKQTASWIVDATAGLARDSFILASLGFEVTLLERSPLIHALIADGIRRASKDSAVQRLHLIQADAIDWLTHLKNKPDIIYLDPMFPERKKSALSKQDMRIFHDVIGDDTDANDLLKTALACAKERVVVKRSRLAPALLGPLPHFSQCGRSSRFDVYLL